MTRPSIERRFRRTGSQTPIAIACTVAAFGVVLAIVAGITEAKPQHGPCMLWSLAKRVFADRFGEHPIGGGVIDKQRVLEVMSSPNGETFTIVAVSTRGIACVIASGTGWQTIERQEGSPL